MLTHDQIDALGDAASEITRPMTEYLIKDIARRVSEAGQLTSTAAYQIWRIQQLGMSQKKIRAMLRRELKVSHKELRELLTQSAKVGYRFDLDGLPTASAIPFAENTALQQIVKAAVRQAKRDFTNLTQTLGMVGPDGKAYPMRKAYRKVCDFAFEQVFTGAADYNTAIRQATKNLADMGVRVIDYESGVHTSLEAAVRRNVMGGIGIMQEEISRQNHDQFGADGWEISAHAASAPDHEPIQGKQYSDEAYTALNDSLARRIGTLNCGHAAFPIILGVSEPQYTPQELEEMRRKNAHGITYEGRHYTAYEATQKQRQVERAIRKQKNRILVDEAAMDDEKLKVDQIRLRRLNEEYRRFSRAAGMRTQTERAQVAGFGRGQVYDYQRTVAKYAKLRYHKDGTIVVTDDWTKKEHVSIPKKYLPNAVVDTVSRNGQQRDRAVYGEDAIMKTQIHGGNHGQPKQHPYGLNGEHVHDFEWDDGEKRPRRTTRNANDMEKIQHKDIFGGRYR